MAIFKKSSPMVKLEKSLDSLRTREAALALKLGDARTLLDEATQARSQNLLTGDLNDTALAAKLQARVDTCTSEVKALDDALTMLASQIDGAETSLMREKESIERGEAATKLEAQIVALEAALPRYLEAARSLHDALAAVSVRTFEVDQLCQFIVGQIGQVEIACAFSAADLKNTCGSIRAGHAPIPKPKVEAVVIEMPKGDPMRSAEEVETVFVIRSLKYRDADGKQVLVQGWEDHALPVRLHARASAKGVIAPLTDERRRTHRGLLGGHRIDNPVDLDAGGVVAQSMLPEGFEAMPGLPPERTLSVQVERT
jgi:hypothetical protein